MNTSYNYDLTIIWALVCTVYIYACVFSIIIDTDLMLCVHVYFICTPCNVRPRVNKHFYKSIGYLIIYILFGKRDLKA